MWTPFLALGVLLLYESKLRRLKPKAFNWIPWKLQGTPTFKPVTPEMCPDFIALDALDFWCNLPPMVHTIIHMGYLGEPNILNTPCKNLARGLLGLCGPEMSAGWLVRAPFKMFILKMRQ